LTWQRTMKDDVIGDWLVPVDIIACTGASGRTFRPSHLAPQSPESGASQALRSPLKLPPEGVAVTVSISPGVSILPDVTFNADGRQHLPSASRLPSASPVSISPTVSIDADGVTFDADGVTFDADGVTFGADGRQHLPSASRPSPLRPQGTCHGNHLDNAILTQFCAPSTLVDALCVFCVVLFIK